MIGAYYETQTLDPIKGLGQVSAQASLAHEALQEFLGGTLGSFAPWGEQTVSGWQDYSSPSYNYTLFPINAEALQQAENRAMGNPVGMIAVLYRRPVPLAEVDQVLSQGPYRVERGEAVYRLDDEKPLPTPQFLYLGTLMDEGEHDQMGSYAALEAAVQRTGGELVFVEPTPRAGTERPLPSAPLSIAVPLELGEKQIVTANAAPAETESSQNSADGLASLAIGVGGLLAGAFVGYHVTK